MSGTETSLRGYWLVEWRKPPVGVDRVTHTQRFYPTREALPAYVRRIFDGDREKPLEGCWGGRCLRLWRGYADEHPD
jgi:hypothetical protein